MNRFVLVGAAGCVLVGTGLVRGLQAKQESRKMQTATEKAIVHAGDGTVNGLRIGAYENVWNFYLTKKDGGRKLLGRWEDEVTILERDGKEVLQRVQHARAETGVVTTFIDEVDHATFLSYTSHVQRSGQEPMFDLQFSGSTVKGLRPILPHNANGIETVSSTTSITLDEPVYNWNLWGVLVAAFPLDEGYSSRFLCYSMTAPAESPLLWVDLDVVGRETIDAGARGEVDCWIVDVNADADWRLWIATDPSYAPVVKIRIRSANDVERWWIPI